MVTANPSSGSEQTKVMFTVRALGDTCCQVSSLIISPVGCKVKLLSVGILKYENNWFGDLH